MFAEMLENHALQHIEVVQAAAATGSGPPQLHLLGDIKTWDALNHTMKSMGFRVDGQDPWQVLGLGREEGPTPTLQGITQRWEFSRLLLTLAADSRWSPADQQAASLASAALNQAKLRCEKEITNILKRRQKQKPHTLPRWFEVDPIVLERIHMEFPQATIALQLSEVHGKPGGAGQLLPVAQARELHSALAMGPGRGVEAIGALREDAYVVWALPDVESFQRMIASYGKYAEQHGANKGFVFVVPFDAPPTCSGYQDILDLWSHPLTGTKWDHIIRSRRILLQPAPMTVSGSVGPVTHMKSFLCVALAPQGPITMPQVINWRPVLAALEVGQALLLDFPTTLLLQVKQELAGWRSLCPVVWDQHVRSTGSAGLEKRLMLRGFLPTQGISEIEARLCLRELKHLLAKYPCLVGLRNIYKDPTALIMEVTDMSAAVSLQGLCNDMVVLSPYKVLLRTEVSTQVWQASLANIMRAAPNSCALKVVWRPSQHGGRPWAQPDATSRQLQAVRAQAKVRQQGRSPGSSAQDLVSELRIQGSLGPSPEFLLRTVMTAVAQQVQIPLQEKPAEQELGTGDWSLQKRPGTDDASGTIRIRLGCIEDARLLEDKLHSSPILIGDKYVALLVSHPILHKLPQWQSGNDQGSPPPIVGGTTL